MNFGKIGIRNGYVFETSMARPRPKSGQVPPPPRARTKVTKTGSYIVIIKVNTFGGGELWHKGGLL